MLIAADLRAAIRCGALEVGEPLPAVKTLATRYSVSVATAPRALSELTAPGEAEASRGSRAVVAEDLAAQRPAEDAGGIDDADAGPGAT